MAVLLNDDDVFTIGTALDDWLEQCEPGDDEISQARYADIERIRENLGVA